jgi:DNA polymerase I-like protein with 3'-5' exonuclease and polymerase domains
VIAPIIEHRLLAKLRSTFVEGLRKAIDPADGRVHTTFNQVLTATGRLSSTEPNLQNIPIRSEEGRRIRQAFVADQGYKIVAADYSQIELRIMAHLSEDEGLLRAFALGQDIHRATINAQSPSPPDGRRCALVRWIVRSSTVIYRYRSISASINYGVPATISAADSHTPIPATLLLPLTVLHLT